MTSVAMAHQRQRTAVSSGSTKKATFRIDESVFAAMKRYVEAGVAASQTALVEDALREYLRELRKKRLDAAYAAAADDPAFMADMRATTEAFEATVADGLT